MASTLALVVLVTASLVPARRPERFEEIEVERINVIEKDGRLRMVISNQERQHPGLLDGKLIERSGPRPPGILFFNHLGDEMGGLVWGENGGKGHFGSLTFDKVKNDQTIGFRHLESDDGSCLTGLEVWQQPDVPFDVVSAKLEAAERITDENERESAIQAMLDKGELTTERLFLGKLRDDSSVLMLSDIKGRTRIRMMVAANGAPKLEFLDENGETVYELPEKPVDEH